MTQADDPCQLFCSTKWPLIGYECFCSNGHCPRQVLTAWGFKFGRKRKRLIFRSISSIAGRLFQQIAFQENFPLPPSVVQLQSKSSSLTRRDARSFCSASHCFRCSFDVIPSESQLATNAAGETTVFFHVR